MADINQSVGHNGKNDQADVDTIRQLLMRHAKWSGGVAASGPVDAEMIDAIKKFQKTAAALLNQDGRVDPQGFTLARLNLPFIWGPRHDVLDLACWSSAWNRDSNITDAACHAAAERLKCEVAAIKAVAQVETEAHGPFDEYGRATILFERHYFRNFTNAKYNKTHPDISGSPGGHGKFSEQYKKLSRAAMLDERAALKSASWGTFQIMGANHADAGYSDVNSFVTAMAQSADKHLEAFVAFIDKNPRAKKALQNKNWARFAAEYNGKNYKQNLYDTKLEAAFKSIRSRPASLLFTGPSRLVRSV
jgi:hypothetical protein